MNISLMKFLPLPLGVGVLAAIWMMLANQFQLLPWVAFLTWGAYFLSGITTKSAVREAIGFTVGIVFGAAIVLMATALTPTLGTLAFPVVVGIAGFLIVLLELVPWFDMAPSYFIGAAAFFAAGAKPELTTMISVFVPGMLGLAFGLVSAQVRGSVLKSAGVKDPLKASSAA